MDQQNPFNQLTTEEVQKKPEKKEQKKENIVFQPKKRPPPKTNNTTRLQNDLERYPQPKVIPELVQKQTSTLTDNIFELIQCDYCQINFPKNPSFLIHQQECYSLFTEERACLQCNDQIVFKFMDDHLLNCDKIVKTKQQQQPVPQLLQEESSLLQTKPVVQVDSLNQENDREKICTICAEMFNGEENKLFLPCCHAYHKDCISLWMRKKKQCPQCRLDIREYESNIIEKPQVPEEVPQGIQFRFQVLRIPTHQYGHLINLNDVVDANQNTLNVLRQFRMNLMHSNSLFQLLGDQYHQGLEASDSSSLESDSDQDQ